jgi:hypothetical protein
MTLDELEEHKLFGAPSHLPNMFWLNLPVCDAPKSVVQCHRRRSQKLP